MSEFGPFVAGVGPPIAPLGLVGEAPGLNESIYRRPFVGEAGDELTRMLVDAGINRNDCYLTNTFKVQPPDNDVAQFFARPTEADVALDLPTYKQGRRVRAEFRHYVDDLVGELVERRVSVCIALGATALWALLGQTKISSFVGTAHPPTTKRPFWVVPTYHPAAVRRQWSWRPIAVANLRKARDVLETSVRRSSTTTPHTPQFDIKINPKIEEVERFAELAWAAPEMAVDIETVVWQSPGRPAVGQIRTISFSLTPTSAFVIPFWEAPGPSYWSTPKLELRAWASVRRALSGPGTKVFQNGAYDVQWLWRNYGIGVAGPIEDTMVAYHSLEPELPKGLGDLAALLLSMPEWKTRREE